MEDLKFAESIIILKMFINKKDIELLWKGRDWKNMNL